MTRQLLTRIVKALTGHTPRDVLAACFPNGPITLPAALIHKWTEKKVMVLAPHPDDEALGCGGALVLHAQSGAQLNIVYVTDGRLGVAGAGIEEATAIRRAESEQCRQQLSQHGGSVLATHLHAIDGALHTSPQTVSALADTLRNFKPDLVYLPFVLDTHEDHWQTNVLLLNALMQPDVVNASRLTIRCFEVWAPLPANRVADISRVMQHKRALASCHATQMQDVNYLHAITGLNAYRAMALPQRQEAGYAEAFYECSIAQYQALMKRVTLP